MITKVLHEALSISKEGLNDIAMSIDRAKYANILARELRALVTRRIGLFRTKFFPLYFPLTFVFSISW
jgi:hypothetical protein